MKIKELETKKGVVKTMLADSFFLRLRGLLGRTLAQDEALLLTPCADIHTFGMRYAIDAVFLDRDGRVLSILRDAQPGRAFAPVRGARAVLELCAGGAKRYEIEEGDHLAANR